VPLNFSLSEGVTELSLVLDLPPGRLTNLTLQALAPEVDPAWTTLISQEGTTWRLHLAARPGQTILGSKQIAQLGFVALANQQSAFVPLRVRPFDAIKADGLLVTNRPAQPGRVVVVGQESLLEATFDSDGTRRLLLYGKPSATYAIEYAASYSGDAVWTRLPGDISLTTLSALVPGLAPVPTGIFYRAVETSANP
jgi:hypothetical protein